MTFFSNRCPHCEKGFIFTRFVRMNPTCPSCGVTFERESGYFVGAMIASYFLGVFLILPLLLLLVFYFDRPMSETLLFSSSLLVILQPFLFRTSRILWIRVEAALTKSIHR